MSKRTIIIAISIFVLLIIGGILFSRFFPSNQTGQETNQNTALNPFGNINGTSSGSFQTNAPATDNQNASGTIVSASLVRIFPSPVAGFTLFSNATNTDTLEFINRANGNIYQYIFGSQQTDPTRITNTTIPKVQESVWSNNGNNIIMRYLNDTSDIISFSAFLHISTSSSGSPEGSLTGSFLSNNIQEIVTNPSGNKIFSLAQKIDGSGSSGVISPFNGVGGQQIFNSPISFLNASWPKDNLITLTTKTNYRDSGFLFFLDTQTGSLKKILGNITGLSTLTNNTGNYVAYSQSANNTFTMDIYDVKNQSSEGLHIPTLADKCAWSKLSPDILYCAVPETVPADNYPDSWYQGTESFSDDIWLINADTKIATKIYQTPANQIAIDAENLQVSPDDLYLIFMNKIDLNLYAIVAQ